MRRLHQGVPLYEELEGSEELLPQRPSGLDRVISAGDVIMVRGMGGAGYGPPELRSEELVRTDLTDGLISPERALEIYGVKVD